MSTSDQIYFGGYPQHPKYVFPSVTSIGFDGCIDQVIIFDTSVDLSRNIQAYGVMAGCPIKVCSSQLHDGSCLYFELQLII